MILFVTGDLGCSIDALPYLDKACSGRNNCDYYVGKEELMQTSPCDSDGIPYLEVAHQCVKGKGFICDKPKKT